MKKNSYLERFLVYFTTGFLGLYFLNRYSLNVIQKVLSYRWDIPKLIESIHNLKNSFFIPYIIGILQASLCILLLNYASWFKRKK